MRLNEFNTFVRNEKLDKIKGITYRHLRRFVADYRNPSIHIKKARIWSLRQFYHYLKLNSHVDENIATALAYPKIEKTVPHFLTQAQYNYLKNDRKRYYDTLDKGHKGRPNDFIFFVGRALERTLYLYLEAIPEVNTQFITLAQAAKVSPYSKDYLNILARRGAIPAFKLKRNWVVSKESLLQYVKEHKGRF
jgi:hypothetical protein